MATKTDAKSIIHKYLALQNRPYSANDIVTNLHNEFGKAIVQKALDDLIQDNEIREKIYGKQKIYCALQDDSDNKIGGDMEAEILQLDSTIEDIDLKLKIAESELKATDGALKDLQKQPSLDDCLKEKKDLEKDVQDLTEKVENLSKLEVNITNEDRDKLYKDSNVFLKEYKKRKRICMDILNSILENCPKPKKALFEEIGIETDEDVGFQLPSH